MRTQLHTLLLGSALLWGSAMNAQDHTIFVGGEMIPFNPAMVGSTINITVPGSAGSVSAATTFDVDGRYLLEMQVHDPSGFVLMSTNCADGSAVIDSAQYTLTPPFTVDVMMDVHCGSGNCQACFTYAQTAPFTISLNGDCSSTGSGTNTYQWSFTSGGIEHGITSSYTFADHGAYTVCLTVNDGQGCQRTTCQRLYVTAAGNITFLNNEDCRACFSTTQSVSNGEPVPFSVQLNDCSLGDAPFQFRWTFSDGSTSTDPSPTFGNLSVGHNEICLNITGNDGCSSDSCYVFATDANGFLTSEPWADCLGVPWGPSVPGTPCTVNSQAGVWSNRCVCEVSVPTACNADFWALQAWEHNGGDTLPIPNELWIWNLSTGQSPYSFVWDFGDGSSSTDPHPSHTYSGTGPYNLCLTITDNANCSDTYCDELELDEDGFLNGMVVNNGSTEARSGLRSGFTINVLAQAPTSVNNIARSAAPALWPNPTLDILNVRPTSSGVFNVEVLTVDGRSIRQERLPLNAEADHLLSVADLAPGVYLLRLSNGNQSSVGRFVKR